MHSCIITINGKPAYTDPISRYTGLSHLVPIIRSTIARHRFKFPSARAREYVHFSPRGNPSEFEILRRARKENIGRTHRLSAFRFDVFMRAPIIHTGREAGHLHSKVIRGAPPVNISLPRSRATGSTEMSCSEKNARVMSFSTKRKTL